MLVRGMGHPCPVPQPGVVPWTSPRRLARALACGWTQSGCTPRFRCTRCSCSPNRSSRGSSFLPQLSTEGRRAISL